MTKNKKKMQAIQISHSQELNVIEMENPSAPKYGEVLLNLDYVGFCGSDLNTFMGHNTMALNPVIPGHEIGATIAAVGEGVPSAFRKGMIVTCNPYTHCGKCASCRNGRVNACEHNETLGVQRNGAMREQILMPWEKLIPAGKLSARECALVEPMSVGFHAVSRGQVSDIDTVMVIGCGMVGLGAIARSVLRGASVIAVDLDDEKLALARQLGATYTINTKTDNVHAKIEHFTNGLGPDVTIEAVGSGPTYQMAIDEAAFTGRVVCIGYAKTEVSLTTKYFVQKELGICGSRNATPSDFRAVIRYLERGTCPMEKLITKIVKPEDALETMRWWSKNPGKVFRILVCFQRQR